MNGASTFLLVINPLPVTEGEVTSFNRYKYNTKLSTIVVLQKSPRPLIVTSLRVDFGISNGPSKGVC